MNSSMLGTDVSKDSLDLQLVIVEASQQAAFENMLKFHKHLLPWLQKYCSQEQVHIYLEATSQ